MTTLGGEDFSSVGAPDETQPAAASSRSNGIRFTLKYKACAEEKLRRRSTLAYHSHAMANPFERMTDDELAALGLQGSAAPLEELYRRYREPLMGYAYRLTGDRALAEDIFQNTFVYFYRRLEEYEPQGKLGAYLFRIAHSLALDEKAAQKRRRSVSKPQALLYTPTPEEQDPSVPAAREEKVRSALQGLSEVLREVVVLRLYQGFEYARIAEITGVSEATARSRMRYALESLRDALGAFSDEKGTNPQHGEGLKPL